MIEKSLKNLKSAMARVECEIDIHSGDPSDPPRFHAFIEDLRLILEALNLLLREKENE